jgi:hypothetical protein
MMKGSGNRHLMEVRVTGGWDFVAFVENLANGRPVSFSGCEVLQVTDVFSHLRSDIECEILTHGLSNLLERQILTEDVVPRGATSSVVRDILLRFLSSIEVDSELIIVDPYFFHSNNAAYLDLVKDILEPFAGVMSDLYIVTLPDKVRGQADVMNAIASRCPDVAVHPKTSTDYHDRFWLSHGRRRGLLTGSSLNGLGRKYALIDRLAEDDVQVIVGSLRESGVLT